MNFAKLVKLAKWFANLAMGLRIWQWVANLEKWFAKLAKWFAKFAMWFANFAMRNFAKVLMFYVRQMNSACGLRISQCELRLRTGCQHIANLAMRNFAKVL